MSTARSPEWEYNYTLQDYVRYDAVEKRMVRWAEYQGRLPAQRQHDLQTAAGGATGQSEAVNPSSLPAGIPGHRIVPEDSDANDRLYPDFQRRKQAQKYFEIGRVFMVLWAEPAGQADNKNRTLITSNVPSIPGRFGQQIFSKVRRFIVIRKSEQYCSVVSILSYGNQGTRKSGAIKSEHGIVYMGKRAPEPHPEELPKLGEIGMQPVAIRVFPDSAEERLVPMSRINYGKVYTVEYNVKIRSVGKVDPNFMQAFRYQFQEVWMKNLAPKSEQPPLDALRDALISRGYTASQATAILRSKSAWASTRPPRVDGGKDELSDEAVDSEDNDSSGAEVEPKTRTSIHDAKVEETIRALQAQGLSRTDASKRIEAHENNKSQRAVQKGQLVRNAQAATVVESSDEDDESTAGEDSEDFEQEAKRGAARRKGKLPAKTRKIPQHAASQQGTQYTVGSKKAGKAPMSGPLGQTAQRSEAAGIEPASRNTTNPDPILASCHISTYTDATTGVRSTVGVPLDLTRSLQPPGISVHKWLMETRKVGPGRRDYNQLRYKISRHPLQDFAKGKIIEIRWAEPRDDGTTITRADRNTDRTQTRRFVITDEGSTWCEAIPILTYQLQGVTQTGLNKSDHSIIYTGPTEPRPLPGELATRENPTDNLLRAIRAIGQREENRLDVLSRLNYARVYRIEKATCEIYVFGWIDPAHLRWFDYQYDGVQARLRAAQRLLTLQQQAAQQARQHQQQQQQIARGSGFQPLQANPAQQRQQSASSTTDERRLASVRGRGSTASRPSRHSRIDSVVPKSSSNTTPYDESSSDSDGRKGTS